MVQYSWVTDILFFCPGLLYSGVTDVIFSTLALVNTQTELVNTQTEPVNTQTELVNTQTELAVLQSLKNSGFFDFFVVGHE